MSETMETSEKLSDVRKQIGDLQKDSKQIVTELQEIEKRVTVIESYARTEIKELKADNKQTTTGLREIERKVTTIETWPKIVAAVAIVFGLSGAFGATLLTNAKRQIDQLEQRIDVLQENASNIETRVEDGIQKIQEEESRSVQSLDKATVERIEILRQISANHRIASGVTPQGNTAWEPYNDYDNTITLWVDTSDANFSTTPIYIPTLLGSGRHYEAMGTNSVYDATKNGFRLYLFFPDYSDLTPSIANDYQWHISWIGLEPLPEQSIIS